MPTNPAGFTLTSRQCRSAWASAWVLALVCALGFVVDTRVVSAGHAETTGEPAKTATVFFDIESLLALGEPATNAKRANTRDPNTGSGDPWGDGVYLSFTHAQTLRAPATAVNHRTDLASPSQPAIGQLLSAPRAPPTRIS